VRVAPVRQTRRRDSEGCVTEREPCAKSRPADRTAFTFVAATAWIQGPRIAQSSHSAPGARAPTGPMPARLRDRYPPAYAGSVGVRKKLQSWGRLMLGMPSFLKTGQIGDGREAACAAHVETTAPPGDLDSALAAIDTFARDQAMLVNIGDEKGELLDAAVRRAKPAVVLELGTYCGYSALRIARAAPTARVYSVEFSPANAEVARRIWTHAGVDDRITCVVGTIGDGGRTLDALSHDHGFGDGAVDLLFIDHDKNAYLSDLRAASSREDGCTPVRSWSPTTSGFPGPRATGDSCVNRRADPGALSSTKPTSSINRCCPIWCWSRSTSAASDCC